MSYQDDLNKHLADYKRQVLRINKQGDFLYRGRSVLLDHILPLADASRNLFEEVEMAEHALPLDQRPKRHRYFHHLNSSQAFAFNLFFPYFAGSPEAASALLRALECEGFLADWAP